jgi:hypothetical protein
MPEPRIFLLSPAHCGGKRAAVLLRPEAEFPLAERFRSAAGAPLGEVFSFLSGLYFRGKMAYASAFADAPAGLPPALVITTDRGLVDPATEIGPDDLRAFARVPLNPAEPRYAEPLRASLRRLAHAPGSCRFVLLGSIATRKYVELMLEELGGRVCFPERFVGMGDMQRGALMLRAAECGAELHYMSAAGALRSRAVRSASGS